MRCLWCEKLNLMHCSNIKLKRKIYIYMGKLMNWMMTCPTFHLFHLKFEQLAGEKGRKKNEERSLRSQLKDEEQIMIFVWFVVCIRKSENTCAPYLISWCSQSWWSMKLSRRVGKFVSFEAGASFIHQIAHDMSRLRFFWLVNDSIGPSFYSLSLSLCVGLWCLKNS